MVYACNRVKTVGRQQQLAAAGSGETSACRAVNTISQETNKRCCQVENNLAGLEAPLVENREIGRCFVIGSFIGREFED